MAQQIGTGIELSARRKDGSEFPIEIMLSPLESAEGILVTAAIRDISVRRAADDNLIQVDRYRGLLEAAPDAMVVVNEFGAIVLVNVQAEKQFGYSRNELIGQKMTNLIPDGFAERLVADDLRTAAEALAQQIGLTDSDQVKMTMTVERPYLKLRARSIFLQVFERVEKRCAE